MSLDRLIVTEIAVEHFGGLSNRRLQIPDDRFVVLHGVNESGKTTLTQLIAWLLVGPYGSASDVARFGEPDETVGGSLEGRLGDSPFTTQGKFKIGRRGAPNASGFSAQRNGVLDLEAWRSIIGGVDYSVLESIYRLSGQVLHDGAAVEQRLVEVALGPHAAVSNIRGVLAGLERDADTLTKRRGALATVRGRIRELRAELHNAESNADRYAEAQQQLMAMQDAESVLLGQRNTANEQVLVVSRVIDAAAQAASLAEHRDQLAALPQIPDNWATLAEDPTVLKDAVSNLRKFEAEVHDAERDVTQSLDALGTSRDALAPITITDADLTEAARLSARLDDTDQAITTTADALRVCRDDASAVADALDVALRDASTTPETIPASLREATTQADVATVVNRWDESLQQLESRRIELQRANDDLERAEALLADHEQLWSERNTGMTALAWLHHGGSAPRTSALESTRARWWIVPAVLAVLAVILAAVGEFVGAVVAAAASATTAIAASRARASASGSSGVAPEPSADAHAAAQAVLTAQQSLLGEQDKQRRAQSAVAEAELVVGTRQAEVEDMTTPLGFVPPATPAACRRDLAQRVEAAQLIHRRDGLLSDVQRAQQAYDDACLTVGDLEDRLGALAKACKIAEELPPRSVAGLLPTYRDGAARVRQLATASGELDAARLRLDALLAPIVGEVGTWRLERIVEQAEHYAEAARQRQSVTATIEQETRVLDGQLGDDPATRQLYEERHSVETLQMMLQERRIAADIHEADLGKLREDVGFLRSEIQDLEHADLVAGLQVAIGALREEEAELSRNAVVLELAARLLRDTSDRYVRTNQPEIVRRASELACAVTGHWADVAMLADINGAQELHVRQANGIDVPSSKLSTAAKGLLYLAFRIALAEHDAMQRRLRLPLLLDDPLVHFDDERAHEVIPILRGAGENGHQVLLFSCHQRTVDAAKKAGASVIEWG